MGSLHAPKGLERVNPTVFRLQQDLHAWNIDGSSVDKPEVGSWIKFWEDSTGRSRSRCAYSDCPKQAEHGGHVWITGGIHLCSMNSAGLSQSVQNVTPP